MKQKTTNTVRYVDYKDIEFLKKFLDSYARIMVRRKTDTSAKNQRKVALAVKRARYMGLLPYVGR